MTANTARAGRSIERAVCCLNQWRIRGDPAACVRLAKRMKDAQVTSRTETEQIACLEIKQTTLRRCSVKISITSLQNSLIQTEPTRTIEPIDHAIVTSGVNSKDGPGRSIRCSVESSVVSLNKSRERLGAVCNSMEQSQVSRCVYSKHATSTFPCRAIEKSVGSLNERTVGKNPFAIREIEGVKNCQHAANQVVAVESTKAAWMIDISERSTHGGNSVELSISAYNRRSIRCRAIATGKPTDESIERCQVTGRIHCEKGAGSST